MPSSKPKTRDAVIDLTNAGRTPQQIARLLDLTTQNIYYHLNKAGVKPAQKVAT